MHSKLFITPWTTTDVWFYRAVHTFSKLKLKYIKSNLFLTILVDKNIETIRYLLLWISKNSYTRISMQCFVCHLLLKTHENLLSMGLHIFLQRGVFAKMHLFKQLFIDNYLVQFDSQWFMKTFWNIFDSNFASFYQIDLWKAIKIWFLCWHPQSFDENKIVTNIIV